MTSHTSKGFVMKSSAPFRMESHFHVSSGIPVMRKNTTFRSCDLTDSSNWSPSSGDHAIGDDAVKLPGGKPADRLDPIGGGFHLVTIA